MRSCSRCRRPGGVGPRELRPYGPGGADVCAECVFGGPYEQLLRIAEEKLAEQLAQPGPLVIDAAEQIGPRSIKPRGKT